MPITRETAYSAIKSAAVQTRRAKTAEQRRDNDAAMARARAQYAVVDAVERYGWAFTPEDRASLAQVILTPTQPATAA